MARSRKSSPRLHEPTGVGGVRLYTLEVFLLSGPIAEKFAGKNPVVSRTIQIRGDQTLEDLHRAIIDPSDRREEHMYEFQFVQGQMEQKSPRYVLPGAFETDMGEENPPAGRVDRTLINSLGWRSVGASATGSTSATTGGTRSTSRRSRRRSPRASSPR